jgi:signal transduction histidine kinase
LEEALANSKGGRVHVAALEQAIVQSDALLALFAAILRISEIEAGSLAVTFQPVDLSHLASDLAESYVPAIADDGRTLTTKIAPGIVVQGDRELIAQAAINLLDNAQHHTPQGTRISLELEPASDGARLTVADSGPGVPPEYRQLIVQRFARLETSRTTPGHGLGLNLVSAIALAHGAVLRIEDNQPGLRVSIVFPGSTA